VTVRRFIVAPCCLVAVLLFAAVGHGQQQIVDPDFKVSVDNPAYPGGGPTVAIDEAHANFHTAGGQYKPFADLLTHDGYRVTPSTRKFEPGVFAGVGVLVVANANARSFTAPAFTEAECDVVRDWVRSGGSLLLISDHAPFGTSAANLADRLGVTMGKGWAFEPTADGITTQLTFSRENGLLGNHVTLDGRSASEAVKVVKSFTGQSLSGPPGSVALLRLSDAAREAPTTDDLDAEAVSRSRTAPNGTPGTHSTSAAGRAQGLAFTFGRGRVVVLGEAAMFSAQVVTLLQGDRQVTFKAGMNAPGTDDRQFALNVMHWLSGILQ
jgi:hypothetical protein